MSAKTHPTENTTMMLTEADAADGAAVDVDVDVGALVVASTMSVHESEPPHTGVTGRVLQIWKSHISCSAIFYAFRVRKAGK